MLDQLKFENLLVFDIETVPAANDYNSLSPRAQSLWEQKKGRFRDENVDAADYYFNNAGILAEFGKVICISAGIFKCNADATIEQFRIKSYYGHDEKEILMNFSSLLNRYFNNPKKHVMAGHNIREFDVPWLCRRMLIHGIKLPVMLEVAGAKPWELSDRFIDTLQLWRFGDFKHYTSLDLLSELFNIPTPKDQISGKDVARVYWIDGDLEAIAKYCEKDVLAEARLIMHFKGIDPIRDDQVIGGDFS